MTTTIKIGTWHEASREITRCPSYYAADTETLVTEAGDYDANLTFEGGYTIPMPYWLLIGIDSVRKSGRLYNGFGGVNFSSTELPADEAVRYTIQTYKYMIPEMVASGRLTLDPAFEWLNCERPTDHPNAPKTWAEVAALKARETVEA